jgi:hypothetical protein
MPKQGASSGFKYGRAVGAIEAAITLCSTPVEIIEPFAAEHVPLSGAARGRFNGDVSIPLLGRDLRCEVKSRGNGFRLLHDWLAAADALILHADRRGLLVVVPIELATEVIMAAERAKRGEP